MDLLMIISEVPPRFNGLPYNYQRSSPQIFMDPLMIISEVPPKLHGPSYDYQQRTSQISWA